MIRLTVLILAACAAVSGEPAWRARWASHPEAGREFGVYHFRRTFMLGERPRSFIVRVTADNRYELFANGVRVSAGPARGDLQHWRYETVDLAPQLRAGRNVLAAVVWNASRFAPGAQFTNETGFLLQGDRDPVADTPAGWKCIRNRAYAPLPAKGPGAWVDFLAGSGETLKGAEYPWGWEKPEYDDGGWLDAIELAEARPRGTRNDADRWLLVPSQLPAMEKREERLKRVVRAAGVPSPAGAAFTVPARTKAAVLFDNGVLTTAYPELTVSGGRGAAVKLTYSESLWMQDTDGQWAKGNRDETGGKQMLGGADVFHPDGGAGRVYRPLWWRTYRYLQLDIETADEPVTVQDLKGEFTAYPFREMASIETPDSEIARIWQTGWRTARLCAHETYMDCPYYEQMQYVGDTRVQALISLYVAGDDRLMRNAIEQFDDSRIPEGITYSRYPSNIPQFIPGFSLLWIGMLHDHWMHRGDTAFVRAHLPGAAGILAWFERSADASGLAGPVAWWPFADWTRGWEHGIPPGGESGGSALFSLQRAIALREAAELEEAAGDRARAGSYRSQSQQLVDAVRKRCWSERRGLFRDAPESDSYSQHVNVLAVLADALPAAEQRRVMEKVLSDASLPQATYYFRHYVARAANKAGLGDSYVDMLGPWREMLKIGLTTWAEKPEPARSDCHAWSASPNYELLATVAGIEPGEPGFRTVRVRPHLGRLGWVRAKMPHPKGTIEVDLRKADGGVAGTVVLPESVRGEFVAGGQRVALGPGRNRIRE